MSDSSERVTCPSCGKGYRWQTKLIDRHVPCKACGAKFIVPTAPGEGIAIKTGPIGEDGIYELDMDSAAQGTPAHPAHNGKCPNCNSPLREGAVLCMNCGFNMAQGERIQTAVVETSPAEDQPEAHGALTKKQKHEIALAEDIYRQHWYNEYQVPLILLGVGLALVLINAFGLTPSVNAMRANKGWGVPTTSGAILLYMLRFALTLVMMLPLLMGGIFFMVAVLGSAFGNFFNALFKLFAMTVLIISLDHSIHMGLDLATGGFGFIGWGIRLSVVFAVFYPLATKLFDMESHEIWVMFLIYVIGPIAIGMFALILAMSFL